MIAVTELERTAREYLRAARMLNRQASRSPDASVYLCGYAVEIALKVCICRTLGRADFPETHAEFRSLGMLQYKTHNLAVLLQSSGKRAIINADAGLLADWSVVNVWNPEQRYAPLGANSADDAREMAEATGRLLRAML